jgi:hypothetical protein
VESGAYLPLLLLYGRKQITGALKKKEIGSCARHVTLLVQKLENTPPLTVRISEVYERYF